MTASTAWFTHPKRIQKELKNISRSDKQHPIGWAVAQGRALTNTRHEPWIRNGPEPRPHNRAYQNIYAETPGVTDEPHKAMFLYFFYSLELIILVSWQIVSSKICIEFISQIAWSVRQLLNKSQTGKTLSSERSAYIDWLGEMLDFIQEISNERISLSRSV